MWAGYLQLMVTFLVGKIIRGRTLKRSGKTCFMRIFFILQLNHIPIKFVNSYERTYGQ